MAKSNNQARARWSGAVAIVLTLGLLALFFRGIDFADMFEKLRHAHLEFVLAALGFTALTYVIRAWRWQALLAPLGGARFRPAFRTTVIGFMASNLLPLKPGEVLRPYLLARHERLNAASAFATVIIERMLDMVTVLLLFGVFLLTFNVVPGSAMGESLREVKAAGVTAALAAVAALVMLFVCAGHPERLARWITRLTSIFPVSIRDGAAKLTKLFAEGLAVMRRPGPLVAAFCLSLPMWMSIAGGIWCTSRAFDLTLPVTGSFLIMMFLVVGVAVPTPSGVGSFHYMYKICVMTYFGASDGTAVAAAIVLHAVSFLPVSLVGLLFIAQDGLTLTGLQRMRETAAHEEGLG